MQKKRYFILVLSLLAVTMLFSGCKKKDNNPDPEELLSGYHYVELNIRDYGTIVLELNADVAPITVTNFISLVESGFYDELTFHRVVNGFVMQGGDPEGTGMGGSANTIRGEFAENGVQNSISHVRGTISMARSSDYDSASSQFFIVQKDSTPLDGYYAAFGKVIAGMNLVDLICVSTPVEDDDGNVLAENQPHISLARVITKEEADAAVEADIIRPNPVAALSFNLVNSIEGLETLANWNIDENAELFLISSDTDLLSLSLYRVDLSEGLEEGSGTLLTSCSNIGKGDMISLSLVVPEGFPDTMLVAEEHNGATAKYLISYDGLNGGANLVPLVD